MMVIIGVMIKKLSIPKPIKAVQPTAHLISAGSPHMEIINAPNDNITTSANDNREMVYNGSQVLSRILIPDNLTWKTNGKKVRMSGIINTNIWLKSLLYVNTRGILKVTLV